MQRTMPSVLTILFALLTAASSAGGAQPVAAPAEPLAATDVTAADIEAVLKQEIAAKKPVVDTPIRVVDAGGHNVGIGLVYRPAPAKGGGASHDKVTEVYHIIDGAGTLVTGGTLVNAQRRANVAEEVTKINGPGYSGDKIEGGASRHIAKGDVVIVPAGTPHWWSEIEGSITYLVVRVDPSRVVNLK
jgi:mannose-6-phosphate isomerase-like protein (cupin superfamily)